MMKMRNKMICLTLVATVSTVTTGCSSVGVTSPTNLSWKPNTWFKKEYQEPLSVATIWKADTVTEPGRPGQRGFGARVYFYNDRSQAIPVDGDLVVHGYLTTPSSRQQSIDQADKKFTFTSEQLASQYSPSDLGASYSIWVPWDEDGGFREEVTLLATFKSKRGGVVQGSPTRLFLPGQPRFSEDLKTPNSVQQVSYQQSAIPTYDVNPSPAKSATKITTIEIPSSSQLNQEPQGVSVGGNSVLNESITPKKSNNSYQYHKLPPPPQ